MAANPLIDFAVGPVLAQAHIRGWTEAETQFLEENLHHMTYAEIGERLGRSEVACKIRQVRYRIPAPSKHPGWYTGQNVARLLGLDIHAVMMLDRRGILRFTRLPNERRIMQIRRVSLWVWAINPENWIYFKTERVRDPRLRRLIELREARWGDEWWTTGQVARFYGLTSSNSVTAAIYRGQIPARRWGNWFIKRSDALARPFTPGKGSARTRYYWPPRADAFILRARDELGLSWCDISRMMKWPHQHVAYRYKCLKEEG